MTVPFEGRKQLYKADDIKSKLTPNNHIADTPIELVYAWVRVM